MPVLQFKGKSVIETYHHVVPHHRLEFDAKLSLLPKGAKPGLDGNLIIEGDNLLALKALLPTHAGKVKCIYIDPPYNTGNEGWVYNDNLTQPQFKEWIGQTVGKEGEDACRHDKWCCMMYPRLALLKDLLREDGAIFVSIGEDEVGHLRVIMDEVFLVEKPLATFVWKRRSPTGMREDPVSVDHEYILMYARDPTKVRLTGLVTSAEDYPFGERDRRYASTDLTIGMTKEERPNQYYTIKNPRSGVEYPGNPNRVWRFDPKTMVKDVIAKDLVIWPDEAGGDLTRPRFKTYFDPANPKIKPVSSWIESAGRKRADTETESEDAELEVLSSGLNSEGGRVLYRIMGKKTIDYPKPPSLIRALVRIATRGDEYVLDSFAGSGTTAQAVLEVNREDGQERRFILVQMPYDTKEQEKTKFNLCRKLTVERVRRVMAGYSDAGNGDAERWIEGLGGSFSYVRLGPRLFGEYRDLGDPLPAYDDLARYIFYTETSRQCDPGAFNRETGLIGSTEAAGGTSYYLLYTPDRKKEGCEMSLVTLKALLKHDKRRNWVIYCEKIWLHQDELRKFEVENGRRIRPMLVPFQLK